MHKFSFINIERALILFVSDSIPNSFSKHALVAFHIIGHDVLEVRHECFFVDDVEIDKIICGYLDSDVSFDVVYEGSYFNGMIFFPGFRFKKSICNLFEK